MSRKLKVDTPPEFSFCEPDTASSLSRWHIRRVGPEGIKTGGGVYVAPLCWEENRNYPWRNGWDVGVEFDPRHFEHACPRCVEKYKKETS